MMLTLQTNDGGAWFKPGELIEGRASWYLGLKPSPQ